MGEDKDLRECCKIALSQCLAIKPSEEILVITDAPLRDIGYAFFEEAREMGSKVILVEIVERRENGEEPPAVIAHVMERMDVIVAPTSKSLSHTAARLAASKGGARVTTLPGVTRETLLRALSVDYKKLHRLTTQLARLLSCAKTARLTCPRGTDITMGFEGRRGHADTGIVHKPGSFSNLPAGEAFIAPVEGSARGRVVFSSSFAGLGVLGSPLVIEVENGEVRRVEGEKADELMKKIENAGRPGRNIAELGIGTNPKAMISGLILEDEKVLGTAHIALGNNRNFGGSTEAPYHLDGMILEPTLWLDGMKVLDSGGFHFD